MWLYKHFRCRLGEGQNVQDKRCKGEGSVWENCSSITVCYQVEMKE